MTAQHRDGSYVFASQGYTVACPVVGISQGVKCFGKNKPLSDSCVCECSFKRLRTLTGANGLNLALHSIRAGGATGAANGGVKDH